MKRAVILFTGLLLIAISYRISMIERPDIDAYNLGLQAMHAGDHRKALDAFRTCVRSTTDQTLAAKAELAQGNIFVKLKEPKTAVSLYKRALRRTPDYLKAKYNLERLLVFMKQRPGLEQAPGDGDGKTHNDKSGKGQGRGKPSDNI